MEVGTYRFHMGSQVLHSEYDMDVYMATFLEARFDTGGASRVEQKARPNSWPEFHECFGIKESRSNFHGI